MAKVTIKWTEGQWKESNRAIEMVRWCRERNLVLDVDFNWNFDTINQTTIFEFLGNSESLSSFFAIVFSSNT